jgi:oligoribonuclease NrnB/cAMP/cGMP phosphodiesterase (DHH superfamily)
MNARNRSAAKKEPSGRGIVRLLTRADFDGSVCAALLQELGLVDGILFVHPRDLQDNKIEISEDDILANVPYVEGCGLWFDHHSSEHQRLDLKDRYKGASELLPSAAQVIFNYYKDKEAYAEKISKFADLVEVAGIADSAQFSKEDILNPSGWVMLSFIADPRTGLGHKRTFRISNLELMQTLPELLRSKTVEEILALPDFQERIRVYREETSRFKDLVTENARIEGDAIIIDFRGIEDMPVGNRFIEYVLYPEQNISIRIIDGKGRELAVISIGHSITNRTSTVDVGHFALKYGGGGHKQVGTCQVKYEEVDKVVSELLRLINPELEARRSIKQ